MFLSDEGPTLETLNFTFHIGSTPTFLYFDSYLTLPTQHTTFVYETTRRSRRQSFMDNKASKLCSYRESGGAL